MSSLSALTHLMQVNAQLEDLRVKLNEPIVPLTNDAILSMSTQLQPMYKKILITNLDEALSRQLDNGLWNDCFKTPLTRFGRTDKNLFHLMIEAGVGFYLGLIQDIGIHFDISFITNTSASNKLYCTKTSQSPLVSPSKASVYYIIQSSLLHVGDLLRYRGSFPEALKMYEKSAAVCPTNGYPFHQMGITQVLLNGSDDYIVVNNFLSSFYYFTRALSVTSPHMQSYNALESLKSKIMSTSPTGNKYHDFLRQYLLMIASTLGGKEDNCLVVSCNVVPMLSPLVTNQQIKPNILFQVIVIALWAQWRCSASPNPGDEEYILEIVSGIINSILIAAVGLFGSGDDLEENHQYQNKNGSSSIDKRFFCIPHLKLLVDWLVRLQQSEKSTKALNYIRDKAHTGTLIKFLNQIKIYNQQAEEDLNNNYILPEEKRLIGFIPLDYSAMRSTGGSLLEETNPKTQKIRINRLVQAAIKLAAGNSCNSTTIIGYDGTFFTETKCSPTSFGYNQLPSRRNVALTSIFRSNSQSLETSPTMPMSLPLGSGSNNTSGSSDIFRSIWTPDGETGDHITTGMESAWN